jgi:hypothetical protein
MQALFAQGPPGGAPGGGGPPPEFIVFLIVFIGLILLVFLTVYILYLLTLSRALEQCSRKNRTMEPGMVWLNLVPCLNLVWQFMTVNAVAESLGNEFYSRRMDRRGEDYGKGLGIATCALHLAGAIPYLGALFTLPWLVCFILYWVKIAGFSKQLAADEGDRFDYEDYEEDDRPRRKKRYLDEDEDDRGRYSQRKPKPNRWDEEDEDRGRFSGRNR